MEFYHPKIVMGKIADAIHKGLGKEIFSFGNTVNFKLKNGKTASVAILRPWLNSTVLGDLPIDLASVIQEREIIQKIGDKTYKSVDKLWLPSKTEMFGLDKSYEDIVFGDTQFWLFNTEESRVKCKCVGDESGETDWYWLRSPYVSNSANFWSVGSGGAGINYASSSGGVCPCFII